MAIGTNAGNGVLSGTTTVTAINGVATFNNLSINKTGVGYTLTAIDGTLGGATSSTFNLSFGAADHLVFSVQPSSSVAGASISPAVKVQVVDLLGNLVTNDTSSVTLALGTNAGNGTLGGTLTVSAVGGEAIFSNLSVDKVGTGYTLSATDGTLTSTISAGFNITPGTAHHLGFNVQPSNTVAGQVILPSIKVQVLDVNGNVVTSDTSNVKVTIGSNPSSGTLTGTSTIAAVNGEATFSDLSIDKAGQNYTLIATDGSLAGATSSTFIITSATETGWCSSSIRPTPGRARRHQRHPGEQPRRSWCGSWTSSATWWSPITPT